MDEPKKSKIFLLLGTNLGDRLKNLEEAKTKITREVGPVVKRSSVYVTAPWGNVKQPDFFNQVIVADTSLLPNELLITILEIEQAMGRVREKKWGPRVIDIDILFYNHDIIQTPDLTIPHPALHERKFTLIPLVELDAAFVHPVIGKNLAQLLAQCEDTLDVSRL